MKKYILFFILSFLISFCYSQNARDIALNKLLPSQTSNSTKFLTTDGSNTSWGAASATSWGLTGNSGTTLGTNFIGTTDNKALMFKINSVQSGLVQDSSQNGCTALGWNSLMITPTTKTGNTAIGMNAMKYTNNGTVTALQGNTAVGYAALRGSGTAANNTGYLNAAFGLNSLQANTTGFSNTALGGIALPFNTTGNYNTAVGHDCMYANTAGSGNTAVGNYAAEQIQSDFNVAIGEQAMQNVVGQGSATDDHNVAIGMQALEGGVSSATYYNTVIGGLSFKSTTTGHSNTGVGLGTGTGTTTGFGNAVMGASTFQANVDGDYNVAMGHYCLAGNISGNGNVALGRNAGWSATTSDNIFLGHQAGYYENTTGSKLYIDNILRASEADGKLKALVYGVMAANTTDQYFTVNGRVLIREDLQFTTKVIDVTAGDIATINSPAGRFRKDNSGTTFTLTDSYITANSVIVCQITTVGLTAGNNVVAVAGTGSVVITFQSAAGAAEAPNASADVNFIIIN